VPEGRLIDCGRVRLHTVIEGSGPTVLLLHGFPEFWYCWRHQIPALADAGFRAVAPDLTGYNLSDKPRGAEAYRIRYLMDDVLGLIRALGCERVHVVAHDWGGVLGWYLAGNHPEVVDRHVSINGPHPTLMLRALQSSWAQMKKSWYIFYWQLPWLPEQTVLHPLFMRRALRGSSTRREVYTDEVLARYREAMAQPGAATGAINWYRAIRYPRLPLRRVERPTLVLWGEKDRFLGPETLVGLDREVSDLRVQRFPEGSHWVLHELPDQVNSAILGFLRES